MYIVLPFPQSAKGDLGHVGVSGCLACVRCGLVGRESWVVLAAKRQAKRDLILQVDSGHR